jgi:hypothetical protein
MLCLLRPCRYVQYTETAQGRGPFVSETLEVHLKRYQIASELTSIKETPTINQEGSQWSLLSQQE